MCWDTLATQAINWRSMTLSCSRWRRSEGFGTSPLLTTKTPANLQEAELWQHGEEGEKGGGGRQPYGSGKADGAVRQAVRIPWLLSITHVTIEPTRRKTTGVHEVINELSTATRQNMMPIIKPGPLTGQGPATRLHRKSIWFFPQNGNRRVFIH